MKMHKAEYLFKNVSNKLYIACFMQLFQSLDNDSAVLYISSSSFYLVGFPIKNLWTIFSRNKYSAF